MEELLMNVVRQMAEYLDEEQLNYPLSKANG